MSRSFLGKTVFIIAVIVMAAFGFMFLSNKDKIEEQTEETEIITSLNVDSFDVDIYIYNLDETTIYGSQYFYNQIYLDNNEIEFDKYVFNTNTKFFLKKLSNTAVDINDIKVSYEPITIEQVKYLTQNFTLLKMSIWLDEAGNCKKVLVYSNNSIELDLSGF